MNLSGIVQTLESIKIRPDEIHDEQLSEAFRLLFQVVEELVEYIVKLTAEKQKLRDEISLMKGEQPKPNIKPSRKRPNKDISSEDERKDKTPPEEKRSKEKKSKIKIDRVEICVVDKAILPDDAVFKGYQKVVVQDVRIVTDNVEYKKEIYYSPSQKKTYMGQTPSEIEGEFGPGVKSLVYTLKHVANMSETKIHEFLSNLNIHISPATISRILTKNNELFHQEKLDIFLAGMSSTEYQQMDDTSSRVNGQNRYVQIICNLYYTAYFTMLRKDRLTILDILRGDPDGEKRSYCFDEEAFDLMAKFRLSKKLIDQLRELTPGKTLDESQMQELLAIIYPNPNAGKINRARIMEAGAIVAYHQQTDFPIIQILLTDGAPQFKLLTYEQALCWVHDGRNYKKLHPVVPVHREKLDEFLGRYWDYYGKLLRFKENPTLEGSKQLSAEFDELFSTNTGYSALDDRIAKTMDMKSKLLMVLKHPEVPLHNNQRSWA